MKRIILKTKLFKKNSIIFTWALSYIIMLSFPTIISIIMYFKVDTIVKNEINRANNFYLTQIQQYMDGIADSVKLLGVQMAYNNNIQEMMISKMPCDDRGYYKIYEGVRELKNYKITNSCINNFYIYVRNDNYIISDTGILDNKMFYDIYSGLSDKEYEEWFLMMNGQYKGGKFVSLSKYGANSKTKIYYIINFPWMRQNDVSANVVAVIDKSQLTKMSNDIESIYKGHIMILNEDNHLITGEFNNEKLPSWLDYNEMNKEKGIIEGKYNGESVVVSYVSSQIEKCKYINIMPKKVFWQKLEYARKFIYLSIILCFALGAIMIFLLLKKNYAPMDNLLSEIKGMWDEDGEYCEDEYQFIKKSITKVMSEKEEYNEKLINQNVILKRRFIEKLLKGNFENSIVNDLIKTYNINFDSNYFIVVLLYIEDFSEVFLEETNYDNLEAFKIAQFAISNMLEELVCKKLEVLITEADGMLSIIFNLKKDCLEDSKEEVIEIVKNLQNFIKEYYKIDFTVAISKVHKDIYGISEAYSETLEAMEYKLVMGVEGIIFYDDTKVRINKEYYYPIKEEQKLINCIKTSDYESANMVIENVYKKNFEERELSPQNAKCLFFNLISSILKTINDLNTISADEFTPELNKIQEIMNYKNINIVKKEFKKIIKVFCEKINENKKNKNYDVMDKVNEYIVNNYKNENLSISSIGDYFHIHPSYISKLYKEQCGKSIVDEINKVRIEKAKTIMKKQKMNLEKLGNCVGYSNVRTFTRAFIKIEGITPGKYKETIGG